MTKQDDNEALTPCPAIPKNLSDTLEVYGKLTSAAVAYHLHLTPREAIGMLRNAVSMGYVEECNGFYSLVNQEEYQGTLRPYPPWVEGRRVPLWVRELTDDMGMMVILAECRKTGFTRTLRLCALNARTGEIQCARTRT